MRGDGKRDLGRQGTAVSVDEDLAIKKGDLVSTAALHPTV